MRRREILGIPIAVLVGLPASKVSAETPEADIDAFLEAASANKRRAAEAQAKIAAEAAFRELASQADVVMPPKAMPFGTVFAVSDPAGRPRYLLEFAQNRPSRPVS